MQSFDMIILVGATGKLRSLCFQGYQEVGVMSADFDNFLGETCPFLMICEFHPGV